MSLFGNDEIRVYALLLRFMLCLRLWRCDSACLIALTAPCNTLQRTVTLCNILQHTGAETRYLFALFAHCNTLQHAATHGNTLQRIATHWRCDLICQIALFAHCNELQRTATHCNALRRTALHCNALQRTATHCNALQHTSAVTRRVVSHDSHWSVLSGCARG